MYSNEKKINKYFFYWLVLSLFLVYLIIFIGGLTRLTNSGLSITEWELIKGILPPLNTNSWENYFKEYKNIPQYKLLTKKQQKDLFIKYNIKKDSNFPTIRREDPQAKFIGLKPGEICHILKPSLTNIYCDYYRICVN